MDREEFFLEVQKLAVQMDDLIDRYDARDEVVCVFLTGSITEDEFGDMLIQAVYGMHVDNSDELDSVLEFFKQMYEASQDLGDEPNWGDFLGDFGISLN
tara:strand:- start:9549 stop:9845 length:297 start_codon:yes stop_codon:yes gene_type:complete